MGDSSDDDNEPKGVRGEYDVNSDDDDNQSDRSDPIDDDDRAGSDDGLQNSDDDDDDDDRGGQSDGSDEKQHHAKSSGKRSRTHSSKSSSKKKKKSRRDKPKSRISRFFDDEAVDNDDSEEEEDAKPLPGEVIVPEDELQAIEAVEKRHEKNRAFLASDTAAIAEEYRRKAKEDRANRFSDIYDQPIMQSGRVGTVLQQSLLPSISDPGIYRVKVSTGKESMLVMSVMRKAIDSKLKGGPLRIKSAFCGSSKGYIYIEAVAEPLVREAIHGLRGIYQSTVKKLAVKEMTAVLNVAVQKSPLTVNQWARVSRGPLKGDLVRIVMVYEGGSKVMIQAVPRPDYNEANSLAAKSIDKHSAAAKARPPQRLFEPSEAMKGGGDCFPKTHPDDRANRYDFWRNEYYRDGFLCKVVNPETYLHTTNVKPKVEEQKMFLNVKSKSRGDGYDNEEEEDEEEDVDAKGSRSLLTELAGQLEGSREAEDNGKLKPSPFVVGDVVQVTAGELRNMVGRVVAVNELSRSVKVVPVSHSGITNEFTTEIDLLIKYVTPGEHVKVVGGQYIGQTGQVVSVNVIEGRAVAAIMTDGVNSEIICDVAHLQVSTEVTTGLGNLMGFELYDLVVINENESAVVTMVGSEKLSVINNMDTVKDVYPQELHGKRNFQSQRSTGFDKNQNTVSVGDVVNVVEGTHQKKSGTIKHIMKGTLWLHSNSHLRNSGVFVVRARSCVVAGIKASSLSTMLGASQSATSRGASSVSASPTIGTKVSALGKPNSKVAKDPLIGFTVRIIKGQYKGHLAQIVDATADHYSVELLTKMKKINIERAKTVVVGDKGGDCNSARPVPGNVSDMIESDNFLLGETPRHLGMHDTPSRALMSATPSHAGDMTPYGSRTPGRSADDVWSINSKDVPLWGEPATHQSSDYSKDSYGRSQDSSNRVGSAWSIGDNSTNSGNPFGSTYNQSASTINSPQNSNAYSPIGAQASPSPFAMAGNDAAAKMTKDWVVNMVVTFKQGSYVGKNAVIRRVPDEFNPRFKVSLRDSSGRLTGNAFDIDPHEVAPAEPGIRTRVQIVGGEHKGKVGLVKNVVGSDLFVSFQDSAPVIVKRIHAVWIA